MTFRLQSGFFDKLRQTRSHIQRNLAQTHVRFGRNQLRQMVAERPDGTRDRHVVVVQNDNQPRIFRSGVIQSLKRHAGAHRPVADHADDIVFPVQQIPSRRHARRRGNGRRAVPRPERIIFAFGPFCKT